MAAIRRRVVRCFFPMHPASELAQTAQIARRLYAECVAGVAGAPAWWTVVAITASSQKQAERYEWEIHRRAERGRIPARARYVVIPDPGDRRVGSGGATLHAIRRMAQGGAGWWRGNRVLLIHSGGDSRRLPQYSPAGKLFTALPVKTPWGEVSTVFDETLALSTAWAAKMEAGLLVGSGDVVLTFDAGELDWDRPGVCGVGMRQPAETGTQHGVYVADEQGRVYAFLQKPTIAEVRAAGGLLEGNEVALDIGLLRFDCDVAARLGEIEPGGPEGAPDAPAIDLYQHITMGLTGQWKPRPGDAAPLPELARALDGVGFWCSVVRGEFTHVGTTTLFRRLLTEDSSFARLYTVGQRLGAGAAGVVVDSVLKAGGELGPGSLAIECHLEGRVRAGRGSVLHGLDAIPGAIEIPEDTVVHQVSVVLPDGGKGAVIRVYGVEDDPKAAVSDWKATWFGRPMLEELHGLGLDLAKVWPETPPAAWSLWNAKLFPVTTPEEAWACARWLMRLPGEFAADRWEALPKLSLEESTRFADVAAFATAHASRMQANWCATAAALAESGSDIRPLLAYAPGIGPLAEVGKRLGERGRELEDAAPTEAASRYYQASVFLEQGALDREAEALRAAAFRMVERAVAKGGAAAEAAPQAARWQRREVTVSAPARIDLGGGWSDTPPFCLDWGGTVLNAAVELNGRYPIRTTVRRIDEPVVRCQSDDDGGHLEEWRASAEILRPAGPGDPFAVPRTALRMTGIVRAEEELGYTLERLGGGIEIRTAVDLPMGSGLGSSSILAATLLRALAEMTGEAPAEQELSDRVMQLEQWMTTGGGWQDQAGGIFPGVKLVSSGPGLAQRLRVQPVALEPDRLRELEGLLVLYYTGIRRIAKGLLQQVVGSYLARETGTVQVLHSIKTLAMEMAYAMRRGEWDYLGELLDRHWGLNQVLDPHTTNAPINALLARVRPYIRGAKLAGAGGGGFMMLLGKSAAAAEDLRGALRSRKEDGAVYEWRIATVGLRSEAQ